MVERGCSQLLDDKYFRRVGKMQVTSIRMFNRWLSVQVRFSRIAFACILAFSFSLYSGFVLFFSFLFIFCLCVLEMDFFFLFFSAELNKYITTRDWLIIGIQVFFFKLIKNIVCFFSNLEQMNFDVQGHISLSYFMKTKTMIETVFSIFAELIKYMKLNLQFLLFQNNIFYLIQNFSASLPR